VVLVLNNRDLNMVTWEQRALSGDPKLAASQDLPDFRYADYAKSLGLDGVRVEHPADLGPAWDRALSAGRPFVLEALTDPDVPPLPPHISFEQAKAFASSVLRGDAEALGFLKQRLKDVASSVMPQNK
jgi:pyruvate dehydrogenase (quinone)